MHTIATAPGKIILFGEHAVVYGRPALAVPVTQVQATCKIKAALGNDLTILAPDVGKAYTLAQAATDDPLAAVIRHTLAELGYKDVPALNLTVTSSIPIACGLGSGAAISTAIVKALGQHLGHPFVAQQVSDIVFEVEKIHHGTPSGIDNTVIAFAQPIVFQKGKPIERLSVGAPLTLVIGDTGVKSPTYKVVGNLRRRWIKEKARYEATFGKMGSIATAARQAIEQGDLAAIGRCMNQNQAILVEIGISKPVLDTLVEAALKAGALGAKLSGAGWGGNMIALSQPQRANSVALALRQAGAMNTIVTQVR